MPRPKKTKKKQSIYILCEKACFRHGAHTERGFSWHTLFHILYIWRETTQEMFPGSSSSSGGGGGAYIVHPIEWREID